MVLRRPIKPKLSRDMRSQNCSLPPHQRFQVLRPLISSLVSAIPPSIGWKTSAARSGKSTGLRPPPSATSETVLVVLQPVDRPSATRAAATKKRFQRTGALLIGKTPTRRIGLGGVTGVLHKLIA